MVNFMIIECKGTKKIAYAQGLCDFWGCKGGGFQRSLEDAPKALLFRV